MENRKIKMSNSIILSINPKHVESIIKGIKKFEYRTKVARQDINKIIIYETLPVKKVVAEAKIVEILKMSPKELWLETKDYSGISKEFYDEYFKGRKNAYRLGKIKVYENPKDLSEFGIKYPPQSFVYVAY